MNDATSHGDAEATQVSHANTHLKRMQAERDHRRYQHAARDLGEVPPAQPDQDKSNMAKCNRNDKTRTRSRRHYAAQLRSRVDAGDSDPEGEEQDEH